MRQTFHLVLIVPAFIGLAVAIFLTAKSVRSDVSEESFPSLTTAAWSTILGRLPAEMPGEYDTGDDSETTRADDLSPVQAKKFATNNAFISSCGIMVLLGILGIGLIGAATTVGEPINYPILRTGAAAGLAITGFLLWGFYLAFPGDFNGVLALPAPSFPGGVDSVEYGMGGMSEWTDLFYIAAYAGMFAALIVSYSSARLKATVALLIAIPASVLFLPVVISWKWGGGWLDRLENNIDFAGAALFHWHLGSIGMLIGGIMWMFLSQPENRKLSPEKLSLDGLQLGLYEIGLLLYFLLMIGMNAGSVLAATPDLVASVLQATLIASAASTVFAVVWWALFRTRGLVQFVGIGLISGAVSVSGAADTLNMATAITVGVLAGLVVPGVVVAMDKASWPDPLAVGPVHGVAGALATVTAAFSQAEDLQVSVVGQLLLLIAVPLLSLIAGFFVLVMAGSSGTLFFKDPAMEEKQFFPPDLPRAS